jgi:cobalamin synthase
VCDRASLRLSVVVVVVVVVVVGVVYSRCLHYDGIND